MKCVLPRFGDEQRVRILKDFLKKAFALVIPLFPCANATVLALSPSDLGSQHAVRILTQNGYLPGIPVLIRVEVRKSDGGRERALWDADAILTVDQPSVGLSTNQVKLWNGLGSTLVTFTGGGDFKLSASVGSLHGTRPLASLANVPPASVGGTLSGASTTWTGVVRVTNDVTVPTGHTLTIEPNTLVLFDGVASGTDGLHLNVNGTIQSLGTDAQPVAITCGNPVLRWGQIRHNSQPLSTAPHSLYRHTSITRAGRAPGEGHTGTAPVIRATHSRLSFHTCSITDLAEGNRSTKGFGTPGKIMAASNSELVFDDCLLARARMGPEISSTSVLCTNTWIVQMQGLDDADGFYVHDQSVGQQVLFTHCVIAGGDDDGIDTLGSTVAIEDCIVRDWNNLFEDAKGVSVFNGATHIRQCLIVNCTVGVGAKWSSGPTTLVTIDRSTITGLSNAVWVNRKSNAPGPFIHYLIANSVMRGPEAVLSDFAETNFTIRYSNTSQPWPGEGNSNANPLFVDEANSDYRLQHFSGCIDTGDPASMRDPDGSPADRGYFVFLPPAPVFERWEIAPNSTFQFVLIAYTNRNYIIESSTNAASWNFLKTVWQLDRSTLVSDLVATNFAQRFYRTRLAR